MRSILILLFISMLPLGLSAQNPANGDKLSSKGRFRVSVNGTATIYLNGKEIHKATAGDTRSADVTLTTGDCVVAKLQPGTGEKRFMLLFECADGQTFVGFERYSFVVPKEPGVGDFSAAQVSKWSGGYPKEVMPRPPESPSEWVWGNSDECVLGSIIGPSPFYHPVISELIRLSTVEEMHLDAERYQGIKKAREALMAELDAIERAAATKGDNATTARIAELRAFVPAGSQVKSPTTPPAPAGLPKPLQDAYNRYAAARATVDGKFEPIRKKGFDELLRKLSEAQRTLPPDSPAKSLITETQYNEPWGGSARTVSPKAK